MLKIIDHGKVREIQLDRPPANAMNADFVQALTRALQDAGEQAGAVVVSGRPGMFSAGLDVPELMEFDRAQLSMFWQQFLSMLKTVAHMPVPTAFAMTGHAPAGGIVLALFGDYRIMPSGNFKTGLNEVQVGLVVSAPIHRALVRAVGPRIAEHILVAGEMMVSDRALDIGLVDELAESPETVISRAIEWCEHRLALPGLAMSTTRSLARTDLHGFFDDGSELGVEKFVDIWYSESTRATLTALVDSLRKK